MLVGGDIVERGCAGERREGFLFITFYDGKGGWLKVWLAKW